MPSKVGQNSFEAGLNTDVNLFNTPKNILIEAKNVTQSTLSDDQFILQNEEGNAEVIYNSNPVRLTPGYIPLSVKVYNNIAYIISIDTDVSSASPEDAIIVSERLTNSGIAVYYNFTTLEYGISGTITSDDAPVGSIGYLSGSGNPPIPIPGGYAPVQFINLPQGEIAIYYGGNVVNNSVPIGTVLPEIIWGSSISTTAPGYKTEIGTFPSPNWELLNNDLPSELNETYSPIHNFKDIGETDYKSPFRAQLGYTDSSEVDIEIQQSFDNSVNIIFTDGKNPVKLVNSRFKPSEDNPNAYILADRTDLASRDTNVYDAADISQTNLIFTLSSIPELTFDGVIESAGKLPEGNYKYYFKAVDADGNETPIIEESRTVSIFSGKGKSAHSSVNGQSSKGVSFRLTFSDKDSENISGINVYYSYFVGEFDSTSTSHKLLSTFRNKSGNSFSVIHTGLETTEAIAVSDLNVQYTPVETAKTLSQIRSRLALANVSYNTVDIQTLAEASFRVRIGEEDVTINRNYSEVYADHTSTSDMLYSIPEDIYGTSASNPGIGYWREETYVLGVNWILENDHVTDTFPIKGIDRVYSDLASYTNEDTDSHDYVAFPFNDDNGHENRLGVYRTKKSALTNSSGQLIVKKLNFSGIDDAITYLKDAGIPVKGYFFTRKDRTKDCLWEGVSGGLHRVPVVQNFQSSSVIDWNEGSGNDNRIYWLPILMSQNEDWENIRVVTSGDSWDSGPPQEDLDQLTAEGLKVVPSNGGWLEGVNPHIEGYNSNYRTPVNGDSFVDFFSYRETGAYDFLSWPRLDTRMENDIDPNYSKVNRVAFHSADMLADLPSVSRDFESTLTFEIGGSDNVRIGFKSGEIGTAGRSLITKFYLDDTTYGSYSTVDTVKASARLVNSGAENAIKEQFAGRTDRNLYKWNGGTTAYEAIEQGESPTKYPAYLMPSMITGSGNAQGGNLGLRMSDTLRSIIDISTEYGTYFGCQLLTDESNLAEIDSFNNSSTYYNTRYTNNRPQVGTYTNFGRYTKVYGEDGSLKTSDKYQAWKSLYNNLSGTYKSVSKRYKAEITADVSVGEGDCFLTIAWKQLTRKRGLPNDITQSNPNIDTYYRGVDTKDNDLTTAANLARAHTDIKNSCALAYSQGMYIPLLHQNNNNVAIRSIEEAEPTEKNLIGSDREFHPFKDVGRLRARPQLESNKYNFGLSFDSNKFFTAADVNVPAFTTEFSTRVVLSNATATSEFSNGYRTFQNINYKDYNRDYGSITKLESFNNSLYCIQESAISTIGVDDRTLTTDAASGKVFINSGDLLPSTLTNINSEYGSGAFYSVIQTDVGIFGVDYIKNRPWRINGSAVELLSEFKTQDKINEYKTNTKGGITIIPIIKTHFDRLTNKVYFNYNVVSNQKFSGTGLGFDQNIAYNTNTDLWIGETEFTPGISFTVNDGFYTIPQNNSGFWKHNQSDNTSFYGVQKEMSIEFVLLGDNPTGQKILENLKIVSNNVTPNRYKYTVEDLTTYNKTGTHGTNNPTFEEPAIVRGDLYTSVKGDTFRANIMQANTQYRENSMDVQVGKRTNTSARVRDKAIKIKIVYDGLEKVTIQQVLSVYRDSFA